MGEAGGGRSGCRGCGERGDEVGAAVDGGFEAGSHTTCERGQHGSRLVGAEGGERRGCLVSPEAEVEQGRGVEGSVERYAGALGGGVFWCSGPVAENAKVGSWMM